MGDPSEFYAALEDYVARATAPLQKRIAELEARADRVPRQGERGEKGADAEVDYDHIGQIVSVAVEKEYRKYPIPQDGRDGRDGSKGDPGEAGRDGRDGAAGDRGEPGPQGAAGPAGMTGSRGEKGDPGPQGEAGPAGPEVSQEAIAAAVERALAAWPRPKDGKDGIDGKDAPALDYALLRDMVIAVLPPAPRGEKGERGEPGEMGRDGLRGPEGPEGQRGEPGRDALDGLASIEATLKERTLALDFLLVGGRRKSFSLVLPIPIYRGLHKEGESYERGDAVTRDGSTWYALKDTDTAPPSADWLLGVKKGRDLR